MMSKMNCININFVDKVHKTIIYKLSKRNKFYVNDINAWLYSNDKKGSFSNWNKYYENNMCSNIVIFPYWKGIFICVDKKVIGYIIYYERHYKDDNVGNFLSIEFMLIDHRYERKGFGKLGLNYLLNIYNDKDYFTVCIERKNGNVEFYKKMKFVEKEDNKTENHHKEFSTFLANEDYCWLYRFLK